MDATIAYEVAKAGAEGWERVAMEANRTAKNAQEDLSKMRTQVARIPGLIQEEKKKAFKEGRSKGQKEGIVFVGIIGILAAVL